MQYYCEISKKFSEKDLLTKSKATIDITKLHKMTDLADQLKFESSEITALKQYSKFETSMIRTEKNKSLLVTDDSEKAKKKRREMSHIQSYKKNQKYLFISHLHDDRNEQKEKITSFF